MSSSILSIIFYLIGIFTFKEILVLNEETIVALSFIIFVWLAYNNLNSKITTDLNEQAKQIEVELDSYWKEKELLLVKKIEYQIKQIELYKNLPLFLTILCNEINKIYDDRLLSYETFINDQINNDFEELINNERRIIDDFHKSAVTWFIFWTTFHYQCQVDKDTHSTIIQQNIKQLEEFSKNVN